MGQQMMEAPRARQGTVFKMAGIRQPFWPPKQQNVAMRAEFPGDVVTSSPQLRFRGKREPTVLYPGEYQSAAFCLPHQLRPCPLLSSGVY